MPSQSAGPSNTKANEAKEESEAGRRPPTIIVREPTAMVTAYQDSGEQLVASLEPQNEKNGSATEPSGNMRRRNSKIRTQDSSMRRTVSGASERPKFTLKRAATTLFTPERKVSQKISVSKSTVALLRSSKLFFLVAFVPVSIGTHFVTLDARLKLSFLFLALISLAKLLGFAMEDVSLRVGKPLRIFLRCSAGNAVELIAGIMSIIECQFDLVQASLVGSILANGLLVLGCGFFSAGIMFHDTNYHTATAQTHSFLLVLSSIVTLMPTILAISLSIESPESEESQKGAISIRAMSRVVSVFLLIIYLNWGYFQLRSHSDLFDAEVLRAVPYKSRGKGDESKNTTTGISRSNTLTSQTQVLRDSEELQEEEEEEEEIVPQMDIKIGFLCVITTVVLIAVLSEFLVASLNEMISVHQLPTAHWVGLILVPMLSTFARQDIIEASLKGRKGDLESCIAISVGASVHLAHLVLPLLIIISWIMQKNLTLLFDPFQSITLYLSSIVIVLVSMDGKGHFLKGASLVVLYIVIAITYWFYPGISLFSQFVLPCS